MPLLLELRYGDRIVINGAVIENIGTSTSRIVVHNQASILRQREFLPKDKAVTPASRTYFMLQSAYMFPAKAKEYLDSFYRYLEEYEEVAPSAKAICDNVRRLIQQQDFYKGMKALRELLHHEKRICPALYNPHVLDGYLQQLEREDDPADARKGAET